MNKNMSPLGQIPADTARDLAYAQRDGRPLGPAQAEGAARIAAYYQECEHHACRCARAAELAAMGRTREAVEVHDQRVRCRLVPK